jgi:hypothetical protein
MSDDPDNSIASNESDDLPALADIEEDEVSIYSYASHDVLSTVWEETIEELMLESSSASLPLPCIPYSTLSPKVLSKRKSLSSNKQSSFSPVPKSPYSPSCRKSPFSSVPKMLTLPISPYARSRRGDICWAGGKINPELKIESPERSDDLESKDRRRKNDFELALDVLGKTLEFGGGLEKNHNSSSHALEEMRVLKETFGGLQRQESFTRSKEIMEQLSAEMNIQRHIRRSKPSQEDLERLGGLSRRTSFEKTLLIMQDRPMWKTQIFRRQSSMANEKFSIESKKQVEVGRYSFNLLKRRVKKEKAGQKLRKSVDLLKSRKSTDMHGLDLKKELFEISPKNQVTKDIPQGGLASVRRRVDPSSTAFPLKSPRIVMARSKVRKALSDAERIRSSINLTS